MAVSPSRVPSCKSVQGLPDTSAFSLRGTCERTPSHPDVVAITPCLQPPRCHSAFPLGSLSPIILALRPPPRLPPIVNKGPASSLRLSETQQLTTSSPIPPPPYLAYCSTLSPDPLPPTTLGKLAAHGRLSIPGMNSTNTIRILIRPVTLLDC